MSEDMKDFSALVDLAMAHPGLSATRPVVEKELLHYEIFQALDAEGLLKDLVFQGGTSLRLCRGSDRFSEDLDFAGGRAPGPPLSNGLHLGHRQLGEIGQGPLANLRAVAIGLA